MTTMFTNLERDARGAPPGERLVVAVIMFFVAALLIGVSPAAGWAWLP